MPSASAWMPIYLGDYLGKTQRLTTEQHGAYLLLIFDYWRNGPPPADDGVLAQITRLSRPAWRKMKPVIRAFFEERDGKLFHPRIEEELHKAEENKERRTDRARKGAEARWSGKPKDASSNTTRNARSNASSKRQALPVECAPPSPTSSKAAVKRARKTLLPEGWRPEPFSEGSEASAVVDAWPEVELDRQLERFADYHRSKGNAYADWQAAWGTWVRNSVQFGQPRQSNGAPRPAERNFEDVVWEEMERKRLAAAGAPR